MIGNDDLPSKTVLDGECSEGLVKIDKLLKLVHKLLCRNLVQKHSRVTNFLAEFSHFANILVIINVISP